ncbi:lysophospholipid acyltransferase family protein [Elioraea rosea]|uniref:lysophospholipid acyltransferase family protein n=1 Tax=Elioraea rosea TaxID=2492390 RepID=UPI001315866A|nr:lysophospholipid acyltransferase family protein [Elioraea rosea]
MFKRLLRHPRTLALGAALLARHLRLVAATTRWQVVGREALAPLAGRPLIGAFWHEQLALAPSVAWNWSGRHDDTGFTVLVSQHRDGRLIGDVVARLGIGAAHGSSRRGGVAVFREAQRVIAEGRSVAITPDGPRGPRRVAQPGVARLARLASVMVVPVGVAVSRARRLGSWDRLIFPLPFGRGAIVYGAAIDPASAETEEALLAVIAAGMTEAADDAARRVGLAP